MSQGISAQHFRAGQPKRSCSPDPSVSVEWWSGRWSVPRLTQKKSFPVPCFPCLSSKCQIWVAPCEPPGVHRANEGGGLAQQSRLHPGPGARRDKGTGGSCGDDRGEPCQLFAPPSLLICPQAEGSAVALSRGATALYEAQRLQLRLALAFSSHQITLLGGGKNRFSWCGFLQSFRFSVSRVLTQKWFPSNAGARECI